MAKSRSRSKARLPRSRSNRQEPEIRRPVSGDELSTLLSVPATQEMPKEWVEFFGTRREEYTLRESADDFQPRITRIEGQSQSWQVELPAGATPGIKLQKERIKRVRGGHRSGRKTTRAFQPAWSSTIFHPARAPVTPRLLRTLDGRRVVPTVDGVFGQDNRLVFRPQGFPWTCIGKVFSSGDKNPTITGSGVLVGPRHVLTASHMVPWESNIGVMRFVPAFFDGSSTLGPGAQSFATTAMAWEALHNVSAHDCAVLRLQTPIGNGIGWFGSQIYDSSWNDDPRWQLIGYPGALAGGQRPSSQAGIAVLDVDTDGDAAELEHHGDSSPGDSGGPLFGFWGTPLTGFTPDVIGVTSGFEKTSFLWWDWDEDNIAAGGLAMVELVVRALVTWT